MRQLIYASVPSGLAPGRSGYCTAAKSPGLRDRLVRELELFSAHEVGEGEAHAFNIIGISGETFAVITRFNDAGPDYTGRASTIAHHLVFESREISALPPPADIARRFTGWSDRWEGAPGHLDDDIAPSLSGNAAILPAATWKRLAGDAGKASIYCDENGRAKPGTLPAPGGADTLALLAEAALLLDDRGWTTPFTTRLREPDNWAVWHASPATSLGALPEPGLTRRATLARSGVLPGIRPDAAKLPGVGPKSHPVYNDTGASSGHPTGLTTLVLLIGGVTLAALALVGYLLMRGGPASESVETPAPEKQPVSVVIPATKANPHAIAALAALGEGDLFRAASEWADLKLAAPAEAESHRVDILTPLRARFVPESLDKLTKELSGYTAPAPEADSARMSAKLTEMHRLAALIGSPKSSEDETVATNISGTLALMAKADTAIPECTVVTPEWTKINETPNAVSTATPLGEAPEFAKFLSESHGALRVSAAPFAGFGKAPAPAFTVDVSARDFVAGRILAVKHPTQHLLLEFSFDARRRLTLTRRHPLAAPAEFKILGGDTPMIVTITDSGTKKSASVLLGVPESYAVGLTLSASLLVEKNGSVTVPAWVASLAKRIHSAGAKPSLQPAGYNGAPRDFPGLETPRSVLEQSLRARLITLRDAGGTASEIAGVERTLTGLSSGRVKAASAGLPWSIVIAPAGTTGILPIIRFE